MTTGYRPIQIVLHWLVAVLIALQFLFSDGISRTWHQLRDGLDVTPGALTRMHVIGGILVLAFTLVRIALKRIYGAPALPAEEPPLLKTVAHITHLALYAALVLVPISGLVAWFGNAPSAAEVHEALQNLMLALIALHVAGALYQHFVLRSDVLKRMTRG